MKRGRKPGYTPTERQLQVLRENRERGNRKQEQRAAERMRVRLRTHGENIRTQQENGSAA